MKRVLALLMVLAMGLALTACARSDVVAVVNKTNIRLAEAKEVYDFYVKQTTYMYATYYGFVISPDMPDYKDFVATMKTNVLNMMAENTAMEVNLLENNLALTEEELAGIEAKVDEEYESMVASNLFINDEDDEEARATAEAEARAAVDEMGYSRSALRYLIHYEKVKEKLRNRVTAGVVVTEADIEAKYDELVAEQAEKYASSPSQFELDLMYYGNPVYAYPEGYRFIKNIVIGLPDELGDQISDKNSELSTARNEITSIKGHLGEEDDHGHDDADLETLEAQLAEYETLVATLPDEIEALRKQGFEEIQAHAEEVLAACLEEGADFDAILAEFSIDQPTNQTIMEFGYPVSASSITYVPSFTAGAMALENVGDISGLIESQYGYHILKYSADVQPGGVPLEGVRAAIYEQLNTEKGDSLFSSYMSYWIGKYNVRVYNSRFKVD